MAIFLLLGAQLDFIPVIGPLYFKGGRHRDFTYEWYKEIGGYFVTKMFIMSLGPVIVFITEPLKQKFGWLKFRYYDNKMGRSMWQYYKSEVG